jgi:transposase-like protein
MQYDAPMDYRADTTMRSTSWVARRARNTWHLDEVFVRINGELRYL